MHNKERKSIVYAGIAGCISIACLTGFAVNIVINKVNENADKAYAEAIMSVQQQQFLDWQAEQDRLAQIERDKALLEASKDVTSYTVDDIITIDGEQYVISVNKPSKQIESEEIVNESSDVTDIIDDVESSTSDTNDILDSELDDDIHQNPESNNTDGTSATTGDADEEIGDNVVNDIPYFGADNVTFDVDGNLVYLVKAGDTLTQVSRLTGYSVQELAEYNHIENVNLIYANQAIRIPASQQAIDYMQGVTNNNVSLVPVN